MRRRDEWMWVICGGAVGVLVVLVKIGLAMLPQLIEEVKGL